MSGPSGSPLAWELRKLFSQLRIRSLIVACLAAPLLFIAVVDAQSTLPADTLFGRWLKDSGYAAPLVVLGFVGQWGIPAVVGLVGGDLLSSEQRHGTWWLLLTRHRPRRAYVTAKALAAAIVSVLLMVLLAASATVGGMLFVNTSPLVDLNGAFVQGGGAVLRIVASWASVLPPTLAFTALAMFGSACARNAIAGVGASLGIGLGLQLVALLNLPVPVRIALPSTAFDAWHGLFVDPTYGTPIGWGCLVSAVWAAVFLAGTYWLVGRRDLVGE